MATPVLDATRSQAWREAVTRGSAWLAEQAERMTAADADRRDVNWFAKLPWPLVVTGRRVEALGVVRHVQRQWLSPAPEGSGGESLHHPAQTNWTNAVSYALGWLVPGARQCEAYDAARLLYQEFLAYVCPRTGGVFGTRAQASDPGAWFDLALQGAGLHAAVAMGDLALAGRAGRFLADAIERQPEPTRAFYLHYDPSRGLRREFDPAAAMQCVIRADAPRQVLANLGFGLHGLIRVSEATGDDACLSAARRVVDLLLEHYNPDWLTFSQNHKIGHVAALLHRHTGARRYADAAIRIADRIADRIGADGRAHADLLFDGVERQPPITTLRTTCDSVLWLACIGEELERGA